MLASCLKAAVSFLLFSLFLDLFLYLYLKLLSYARSGVPFSITDIILGTFPVCHIDGEIWYPLLTSLVTYHLTIAS
jgi:hypothetical protein